MEKKDKKDRKKPTVNGPVEWKYGTCLRFVRHRRGKKENVTMVGRVDGYEWLAAGVMVRIFSGGLEFRLMRHLMTDIVIVDKELVKEGDAYGVEQLHHDVKNLKQRIQYFERQIDAMDWVGSARSKKQSKLDDLNVKLEELKEQKSKAIKSSSPEEKKEYMRDARAVYHSMSKTLRDLVDDMDDAFDDGMDAGEQDES